MGTNIDQNIDNIVGKTSWHVYKTEFLIVEETKALNSAVTALHAAISLRGDAADILVHSQETIF